MMLLASFLPLLFTVSFTALWCVAAHRSFGKMLPFGMMVCVFTLYLGQLLCRSFRYPFYLLLIASAGGAVLIILSFLSAKAEWKSLIFSSGFFAFIAVYFIFLFIDYGRNYSLWDEFMNWGKMVKEMVRLDRFYYVPESTLYLHKDYPPFTSLYELLWCMVTGGYSECYSSMALHVFTLSLITPVLADTMQPSASGKKWYAALLSHFLLAGSFIVLILFLDNYGTFHTIYPDIFIGVMFAFSIFLVYTGDAMKSKWGYSTYVLSVISLISIKQIGIAFVLIALFYFIASMLLTKEKATRKTVLLSLIAVLLPLFVFLVWSKIIAANQISGQFDLGSISLNSIIRALSRSGLQRSTAGRFIAAFFTSTIISSSFPVTCFSGMLLVLVAPEILWHYSKTDEPRSRKRLIQFSLFCGTVGYTAVMFVLYLFCFEEAEMTSLGSFPRYMGSYFTSEILFLCYLSILLFKDRLLSACSLKKLAIVFSAVVILFSSANMDKLLPQGLFSQSESAQKYQRLADELSQYAEVGSQVYILSKNDFRSQAYISYYLDEIHIDNTWTNILTSDLKNDAAVSVAKEILAENDYLYVLHTSDAFNSCFAAYNDGQDFIPYTVYSISFINGEPHFMAAEPLK